MEHTMKALPIGIQNFENLITSNLLYVDKTKYLYTLITEGSRYFFSRPRRFGKSLTISTLDAIFSGKKELFKGLWIYNSDYHWKKYPVIRLDMSGVNTKNSASLHHDLLLYVRKIGEKNGVYIAREESLESSFRTLIQEFKDRFHQKVVILIDEYDKPIVDTLEHTDIAITNRNMLRLFYGIIKEQDENVAFAFLTGVSKFAKVSIFSGLNNLEDISMSGDYSMLCGYTEDELQYYFREHIHNFSRTHHIRKQRLLTTIRQWYNGFRFSKKNVTVYNPFSTLLMFKQKDFGNYWFQTGTPRFLIQHIQAQKINIVDVEHTWISAESFESFEIEDIRINALLFQTGYFTIKDYKSSDGSYRLGYPNKEVEIAFTKNLLRAMSNKRSDTIDSDIVSMADHLEHGKLKAFFDTLYAFIAGIPYTVRSNNEEKYYQGLLYTILRCLGVGIEVEVTTNKGRIDVAIVCEKRVYVCEFKLHGTKEQALKQIEDKKYYEKYATKRTTIVLVGIEINRDERNIGGWIHKKM